MRRRGGEQKRGGIKVRRQRSIQGEGRSERLRQRLIVVKAEKEGSSEAKEGLKEKTRNPRFHLTLST